VARRELVAFTLCVPLLRALAHRSQGESPLLVAAPTYSSLQGDRQLCHCELEFLEPGFRRGWI
jgi:hypothetical protein